MTDLTAYASRQESNIHTNIKARQRLAARYRSEWIFKMFGLGAIVLAVGFLLLLLLTIVVQGVPAFTYNFFSPPFELTRERLKVNEEDIAGSLKRANYDAVVRDAIRSQFPDVKGRRDRRALSALISPGAPTLLRQAVLNNPSAVIDGKQKVFVPISDFADLYLKGQITASRNFAGTAALKITPDGKVLRLNSNIAAFAPIREFFKMGNNSQPARLLTRKDPSVFIYVNDGVLKLTRIGPDFLEAQVLSPLKSNASAKAEEWKIRIADKPEADRKFSDQEIVWTDILVKRSLIQTRFNSIFFTRGASREPEMAGVLGALAGSALTMVVTLVLAFPLGVASAIYLEEFAPRNKWTGLIEVNINNLAAVPSIVFGLLGLAVFLNFFAMPRSAPLVGGMVLALMTLPTIIISSRAALRAVPPSIREAALGIGASKLQAVVHHVLPLAMPGIMTGTILGMAQALGESAPLLMIGMVAFVVDIPGSFFDPSTVLPVQIFMWADFPEPAFLQRTSAAILVLLAFLVSMNALAVILRKQFERRW